MTLQTIKTNPLNPKEWYLLLLSGQKSCMLTSSQDTLLHDCKELYATDVYREDAFVQKIVVDDIVEYKILPTKYFFAIDIESFILKKPTWWASCLQYCFHILNHVQRHYVIIDENKRTYLLYCLHIYEKK